MTSYIDELCNGIYKCTLCSTGEMKEESKNRHLRGSIHALMEREKEARTQSKYKIVPPTVIPADKNTNEPKYLETTENGGTICKLCQTKVMQTQTIVKAHLNGKRHRCSLIIRKLKQNKTGFLQDKNNIELIDDDEDDDIDDEINNNDRLNILRYSSKGEKCDIYMGIINNSDDDVILRHIDVLGRRRGFKISLQRCEESKKLKMPFVIEPGERIDFDVVVRTRFQGNYMGTFIFSFEDTETDKEFRMGRIIEVVCRGRMYEELKPTKPYKKSKEKPLPRATEIIDGRKPDVENENKLEVEIPLGQYRIPKQAPGSDQICRKPLLASSFAEKFHALLFGEERQMLRDIREYDMKNEAMTRKGNLLCLKVPGLAENRPSVLRGDHLFVRKVLSNGERETREFKGYVHDVQLETCHLGFSPRLMENFIEGQRFDVRFTFNRNSLQLQHRAIDLTQEHSLDKIIFPDGSDENEVQPVSTKLFWNDPKIPKDYAQETAVRHIVSGTSRPAPYIIYGPPGTGKTLTMVEAMRQVVHCIPGACILACAPSNWAADLLAQGVLAKGRITKSEIFRMYAFSRNIKEVPEELKDCCNFNSQSYKFQMPPKDELQKYKIVVTTLATAGRLVSANFPAGHFTHVFIDEAGFCTEPETLIAIAGIIEPSAAKPDGGQIVLAGDPHQLRPVIRSVYPSANKSGDRSNDDENALGISFLERLMLNNPLYKKGELGSNPRLVVKLVKNYRSHPDIIQVPNELFYHNEVEASADFISRESLCQWNMLPKKGFPIIFHGVMGKEEQEERSPSFFNAAEAEEVLNYLEELLKGRKGKGIQIKASDIGVIAPYRRQVKKIKDAASKKKKVPTAPLR